MSLPIYKMRKRPTLAHAVAVLQKPGRKPRPPSVYARAARLRREEDLKLAHAVERTARSRFLTPING